MENPTSITEGNASFLRTLFSRSFRAAPRPQNFVRPAKQSADPGFPCPKCEKTLFAPASQAGKKARCRHCYAPILNARPQRNRAAVDLSQDLDPVAHPGSYPLCGHRAVALDYVPRSALAALPLLCLITLALALIGLTPKGNAKHGAIAAAYHTTPMAALSSPAIEAEQRVVAFLSSPDWTHCVGHVHEGLEHAAQIEAMAEKLPEGDYRTSSTLNADGSATVHVRFRDGTRSRFNVAHIGGEDLIVWNPSEVTMPGADYSRMVGMPEMEPE